MELLYSDLSGRPDPLVVVRNEGVSYRDFYRQHVGTAVRIHSLLPYYAPASLSAAEFQAAQSYPSHHGHFDHLHPSELLAMAQGTPASFPARGVSILGGGGRKALRSFRLILHLSLTTGPTCLNLGHIWFRY